MSSDANRFTWKPGDIEWDDPDKSEGMPSKEKLSTVKPVGSKFRGVNKRGLAKMYDKLSDAIRYAGSE